MNDLVDGSEHCDWIPDSSYCFRVRPITCSLACLYGNLLNGYQGLRPKMFTQSLLAVGGENYMVRCCLVAARIVVGWCRVFVYDFLGSFLSLLLGVITNKSALRCTAKWLTQETMDDTVKDPGLIRNHVGACHQHDSTPKELITAGFIMYVELHLKLYIAATVNAKCCLVCLDVTHIQVKIWVSV